MTVETVETKKMLRHRWCSSPGCVNHQTNSATDESTDSTHIPAAPMAMRCHLLGIIQESLTSQYSVGLKTRMITPISWHSPPKWRHVRPCPNSCRIFVAARVRYMYTRLGQPKNCLNSGRFCWNVANCM